MGIGEYSFVKILRAPSIVVEREYRDILAP